MTDKVHGKYYCKNKDLFFAVKWTPPHYIPFTIYVSLQFRLGQCGVCHPVYLVEEFGDVAHLKPGPRALEQAITNTQVISLNQLIWQFVMVAC